MTGTYLRNSIFARVYKKDLKKLTKHPTLGVEMKRFQQFNGKVVVDKKEAKVIVRKQKKCHVPILEISCNTATATVNPS